MFQDDIFENWLDSETKRVLEKFKNNQQLSVEDKMVLTLKAQTNHFFAHLDIELREEIEKSRRLASEEIEKSRKMASEELKAFREEVNRKFEENNKRWDDQNKKWDEQNRKWEENNKNIQKIYESINSQTWKMIGAVGLIVILGKLIDTFGK